MKIIFTKRRTLSTSGAAPLKGATQWYLKASAAGGKSTQGLGNATILADGSVEVRSCSGTLVGVAAGRKEAATLIHEHHKANDLAGKYWYPHKDAVLE